MLLAIDIGNTHCVFGVFSDGLLSASFRLQSNTNRTVDEYALALDSLLKLNSISPADVSSVIVSCVVPPLTRVFSKLSRKYFKLDALFIGPGVKTGMEIRCDNPREVGADRIVNAVAAKELYGAPALVVDFGTATTIDVVSTDGQYEGGVIAPGLQISADALFSRAAKLSSIELQTPTHVVGKNTRDSVLSGVMYGYSALVTGLINQIQAESDDVYHVIATGGLANTLHSITPRIEFVVPELTLRGLEIIARRNT